MKLSKSYYRKGDIYAENPLDYLHEKGHEYLDTKTNYNMLCEISVFLLIFTIIFSSFIWKISAFIFWIGLQIIEELFAWGYAYGFIVIKQ